MSVSLVTSWADNTETQVYTGAVRIGGIEVIKNPDMASGEIWVELWNLANPDLGANTDPPDLTLYVPGPTTDRKFSLKYKTDVYFDTALAWFVAETAGDFGDAVTTTNVPLAVRVFYVAV